MNILAAIGADQIKEPMSGRLVYGLGLALMSIAYFLVFWVTGTETFAHAALSAFRNVASLGVVMVPVHAVLTRWVLHRSPWTQLFLHMPLAVAFSLLWYWLLLVFIGLSEGTPTTFQVERFLPTSGVRWQLLQGVTVYALVATITALRRQPHQPGLRFDAAPAQPQSAGTKDTSLSRYFIRRGEEILPMEASDIVSITGADDYAEVSTCRGERHLVRMTLTEFEHSLDGDRFIRVHRSRIANIDWIERAEPAGGGRMLLRMQNGEIVQTSRAGAKLLRNRVL